MKLKERELGMVPASTINIIEVGAVLFRKHCGIPLPSGAACRKRLLEWMTH